MSRKWRRYCENPALWRTVDLSHAGNIKKVVLGLSLTLPMVRTLRARNVPLPMDVLRPLFRRLRSLRELDLAFASCPSQVLPIIVQHCPNLEVLNLAHCKSIIAADIVAITYECSLFCVG